MTYFTASSSYQSLTTKHKHMITMKNIKIKSPLRRDDHHHFFRMKFGAKLPGHHAKASQMQQIMMFCQTLYNLHCSPPNQLCNRLDFSIYFYILPKKIKYFVRLRWIAQLAWSATWGDLSKHLTPPASSLTRTLRNMENWSSLNYNTQQLLSNYIRLSIGDSPMKIHCAGCAKG